MIIINRKRFIKVFLISLLVFTLMIPTGITSVQSAQPPVELGTTSTFAVLAGSAITNTGPTTISGDAGGDVGLFPGTAFTGQESMTISGTVHVDDAVAEGAKDDLQIAYDDAAGRTPVTTIPTELGGSTLTPGVYDSADGTFQITGTLTLDGQGDPDAVFIFKTASTLTTATGSSVMLINSAQYCRIFWQVTSSATLGTNSQFVGHIFALTSITANNGATVQGQLLARNGAVTLDSNTITNGVCVAEADPEPDPDPDPDPEPEPDPEPDPTPTTTDPETEPDPKLPQTGQTTDYSWAIVLGSLAVLLAGTGAYLANKRKKSSF